METGALSEVAHRRGPGRPRRERRREALILAAIEVIRLNGPECLTVKRVAAQASASTMTVYSEFGDFASLVAAVVDTGFDMLAVRMRAAQKSPDPLADLWAANVAYLDFARTEPGLLTVIYSVTPIGGYRRSGQELLQGGAAFKEYEAIVRRCLQTGKLRGSSAFELALKLWTVVHGVAVASIAGYLDVMLAPGTDVFPDIFRAISVGYGASRNDVERAIAAST